VNPRVPEAFSDLLESVLSRDPARRPVDTEVLRRELVELLEDPGPDYAAPVHSPSEQRQPEPSDGAAPAMPEPASKPVRASWGHSRREALPWYLPPS